MSFSITLLDASFFKRIISALELIEEPIFRIEPDRFLIRQMDEAHVSLVHLEIPKEVFTSYDCEKPDMIKINREDLLKCMRKVTEDQSIGFSIQEGHTDKLVVTISERSIKDFTIPIYSLTEGEEVLPPPVTKAFAEAKIKMDSATLAESVFEFKGLAEKFGRLDFHARKDYLRISSLGTGRRGLTITHTVGSDILAMELQKDSVESSFPIDYLSNIIEAPVALSGVIIMEFANERPLKVSYELPWNGELYYYLSPMTKIERAGE